MSEALLEALMQLFALLTDVRHADVKEGRRKVEDFLSKEFNKDYVRTFVQRYDYYISNFHDKSNSEDNSVIAKQVSDNLTKLRAICDQVNQEIDLDAKILLISTFLNYIAKPDITLDEEQFVDALAETLRIPPMDYWNLKDFTLIGPNFIADKEALLIIDGSPYKPHPDIKHIYISKMGVKVWVLHIKCTNTFLFRYHGERNLYLNGHKMELGRVFPMAPGSVINTSHVRAVYYGHIAEKFITRQDTGRILYQATDIEYKFSDSNIAIHRFSFLGKSGQLVGIMGGSGTGKSTLINVMNGNYKLSHGAITINGYDLTRDKETLKGVIGYVPQDDMLNEELTVYENLLFNARLIFSNKSREEQNALIEKALNDFDLVEARDLRVGSPLNKVLSGGQRKRLNIALELMREPSILFADEPTSGLSSIDSEKVMMLLKRQVLKGKLVIINIHQPNSDLYKLLDKLLIIDQGGRIVYNGNPMNAIVYFKRKAHYVNQEERECFTCGNVKTEQPLRIIEARMVDPYGKLIRKRKVSADEWYKQYCDEFEASFEWKYKDRAAKEKLPANLYSIPGRWSQFKTFMRRDAMKKLKDGQYMLINMLEVPFLALILAFATKYLSGLTKYDFYTNDNIPTFLFMSVVVALFVGLNSSAEEIIKDRKLLVREKFLNLSRSAYLNSKIMNLLGMAAVQSLLLTLIGNSILEIKGMTWGFWGILFTTFAWAIIFGLNISSGFKSAVTIYISIPLVLVPQLLFSGTMVSFDRLHPNISNREYTPILGDIMASRWSYEALAVFQYMNNDYETYFYDAEQKRSGASYAKTSWIPELQSLNDECQDLLEKGNVGLLRKRSLLLFTELSKLESSRLKKMPSFMRQLFSEQYGNDSHEKISQELQVLKEKNSESFDLWNGQCDSISNRLIEKYGSTQAVVNFKHKHTNEALNNLLLSKHDFTQIMVYPDMMVRKKQPIYNIPDNHYGRAQFYAPYKRFATLTVPTPLFNIIVLWLSCILFYFTLYFDLLRRFLSRIEESRMLRMHKKLQKLRG
ncbi:MAG: ATP-binding cassette domain-containing protein [Marinilabiliaceae bacterium]|nr:ATP-binding cassette domain-containing protein [Marinilabiliaceae bacterium]